MKVFFSGVDDGDYISSLISGLKKKDINVINGHDLFIQKRIPKGAIIHIHWPESYFKNWLVEDNDIFEIYRSALKYYSQHNQIIFTIHNITAHEGKPALSHALYENTIQFAHLLIHLGPISIDTLVKKYHIKKSKKQVVVPHHILPIPKDISGREEARVQLSLPSTKYLMASIGSLRFHSDVKLLWQYFEQIKATENVFLFIHKYRYLLNRYFILNLFNSPDITMRELYHRFFHKNVFFNTTTIALNKLCTYISAADLILLPRTKNLNSGVPFLVCNFHKPIISNSSNDNIQWSLEQLGYKKIDGIYELKTQCSYSKYNDKVFSKLKETYFSV